MPLRQYFTWVGNLLLAGLFAADWCFPVPVHALRSEIPPNQMVNLRIRSDQKWPERVVFDTTGRLASVADVSPESDVPPSQDFAQPERLTLSFLQTLYMAWFRIEESEHATNKKTHRS
jgi:hypothetical protein